MEFLSIQRVFSIDVWVGHNTLLEEVSNNKLSRLVVFDWSNLCLFLFSYILDQLYFMFSAALLHCIPFPFSVVTE